MNNQQLLLHQSLLRFHHPKHLKDLIKGLETTLKVLKEWQDYGVKLHQELDDGWLFKTQLKCQAEYLQWPASEAFQHFLIQCSGSVLNQGVKLTEFGQRTSTTLRW